MMEELRSQWVVVLAALDQKFYWRVHPTGRPFGPEDATSTTFNEPRRTSKGYSCFDDPWHLWLYLDANRMYEGAKGQTVIGFTGERIGTGNDGEDLVMPDMRTVRRISFADFEAELANTPLPSSPRFSDIWPDSSYRSWRGVKRLFSDFDQGDDPIVDRILATAMPSWRGLMHGPVWTEHPGVILVDKGGMGRQTYEVYVDGEQIGRGQRLDEAKQMVEEHLGPCSWSRVKQEPIKTEHYYFGPQTWFGDPSIVYVGEPLVLSG